MCHSAIVPTKIRQRAWTGGFVAVVCQEHSSKFRRSIPAYDICPAVLKFAFSIFASYPVVPSASEVRSFFDSMLSDEVTFALQLYSSCTIFTLYHLSTIIIVFTHQLNGFLVPLCDKTS